MTKRQIRPLAKNPNRHTQRGLRELEKSVREDGWVAPITVAADGESLDGAARLEVAADVFNGVEPMVVEHDGKRPVVMVRTDIPNAETPEARRIAYRANRVAELDLDWDADVLAADVEAGLDLTGLWDGDELREILPREMQDDPGAQVDKAAELQQKWGTATGQLWQIGEHRLICGDCTDATVVDAVALGNVDLWVTDPPYGVSYADKNAYLNAVAFGNRIQVPIVNDHLTVEQATDLWHRAFAIVHRIAKPGCVYYVNAPQGGDLMMMMMSLRDTEWLLKPQIIWVKNNHVLGRSDYQLKHEPILYGWKEGSHYWSGSRSQMSVWEFDKPLNSDLHPTQKPVELVERAIENSSRAGDAIFDGFVGSGTTIVACERLGRKCRAIEIDPGYVAVCLQRLADMGLEPKLISEVDQG